jgi:hypothetical protein
MSITIINPLPEILLVKSKIENKTMKSYKIKTINISIPIFLKRKAIMLIARIT